VPETNDFPSLILHYFVQAATVGAHPDPAATITIKCGHVMVAQTVLSAIPPAESLAGPAIGTASVESMRASADPNVSPGIFEQDGNEIAAE
jgi:hypothetical protein